MYTLRPMLSWQYFHTASVSFQLYLKMHGRVQDDNTIADPLAYSAASQPKVRQQEQRLFWSAFKSESEFRVELPLPQSEIAEYDFPNLFPSPPSPVAVDGSFAGTAASPMSIDPYSVLSVRRMISNGDEDEIKRHAKKLCNEEESWYYYLTEIALRRIGNRVINTFFRLDKQDWLNIEQHIDVAIEFEVQVSTWQTNLPPAMQKYETNSTIRAPRVASPGGAEAGYVSRELSWATENRLLEMRHWLYQPFLYYLVHQKPAIPPDVGSITDPSDKNQIFWALIARAIDCNLSILETRTLPHRHHGLWFDLRNTLTCSLILLAVVKAGYEVLIPGGRSTLVGNVNSSLRNPSHSHSEDMVTNPRTTLADGKLGRVLRQLEIWSHESPDMIRARDMLVMLISQILG